MRSSKFSRGDTIKILPDTPYNRAPGSVFIVRNVFQYSSLNETVRENLKDLMEIDDETPVYYCSDEINYNCFVPESFIERGWFFKVDRPIVEAASPQDKMFLRVAMIAEAIRNRSQNKHWSSFQPHREDVHYGDEPTE